MHVIEVHRVFKKNSELCNRNLNNKHMTKDAEIEQGLSLPNEEWQRKKLRLPHSQKREVEKPQKRRSREPTLFKDYRRFCQSESDVHGSETEIRGSECKKHGSECGNRHIRSHDPLSRSEKSPLLNFSH